MKESRETEYLELAYRLIKDNPTAAMEYLDCSESHLNQLYAELNEEVNNGYSDDYPINW